MHQWVQCSISYPFLFLLLQYFSIKFCNIFVSFKVGFEPFYKVGPDKLFDNQILK
jgi:hypothetical protein